MGFFLKFWLDESVRRNVWVSMKNFFLLVENRVFQKIMVHFFNLTFGFEKFARQTKLSSHPGLWEFFYSALNHRHPRVHFFFCAWSTSTRKYKQGSQRSGKTWKSHLKNYLESQGKNLIGVLSSPYWKLPYFSYWIIFSYSVISELFHP